MLLNALIVTVVPIAALFIPGIFIVHRQKESNLFAYGARIMLWSMGTLAALSFLTTMLGFNIIYAGYAALIIGIIAILKTRKQREVSEIWHILSILLIILSVFTAFAVPQLFMHDGLPTGDSQKAILWAQQIIDSNRLPDYAISRDLLNRDPVDFYTPVLHSLTALIMSASSAPLTAVALFAVSIAAATAWIGAAIARELFPKHKAILFPLLAALLILTNIRFLRYIKEPGYHFQNIVGEFFLFGIIFLGLHLLHKWRWSDFFLAALSSLLLMLIHQFSAFIAIFALTPIIIAFLINKHKKILLHMQQHKTHLALLIILIITILTSFLIFGIHKKIPHLFTTTPHLLSLTPSLTDYPLTMGTIWFTIGITGLALLAMKKQWTFIAIIAVLFTLSQGPRIFIDIPPIRALFYIVVPLSISGAYFLALLFKHIYKLQSNISRIALTIIVSIIIITFTTTSARKAYATISHDIRTNSTLIPEQLMLTQVIKNAKQDDNKAILIDDYNRRSASWLVLSGQPMFTRIAANLERQMNETSQSKKRYEMYLNQLDYEKIFALASKPYINELMKKHDIYWVTGIQKSSDSGFKSNPSLAPGAIGNDITLYKSSPSTFQTDKTIKWLLRSSTLANDIGDKEDTFEHLQASIRAARLSEPENKGEETYRTTNAEFIPLKFNVGDYVRVLWDKENTGRPDIAVEFYISFADAPPQNLTLITPTDAQHVLNTDTILLPANEVPFDDKGFITLTIHNPNEEQISIDLIALGLARTP